MARASNQCPTEILHSPFWSRGVDSLNLVLLLVMAACGLQIDDDDPVFGGRGGATVPELVRSPHPQGP